MRPDRIVIGTDDKRAEQRLYHLYEPIQRNHDRMVTMHMPHRLTWRTGPR